MNLKEYEVFLFPKVTDNYRITWKEPDAEAVVDFLCRERDFSEERVRKAQENERRLERSQGKSNP
ncbi:MAG: hypothetical protein OEX76_02525 [Candidatus Bathyarchaeota archaeon]|nr:hypothetical protein [Candidatus Bathyarchaeota archaeon]